MMGIQGACPQGPSTYLRSVRTHPELWVRIVTTTCPPPADPLQLDDESQRRRRVPCCFVSCGGLPQPQTWQVTLMI